MGSYSLKQSVKNGPVSTQGYTGGAFYRGWKQYELTNHLGNVLAVVSDKKIGVTSAGNSSLIDHYEPEIVSATDYYPFGMSSRVSLTGKGYRFGFNGKENDNDVKGYGLQQDYGMRIYDPRVGRFLSVDPITRQYPWYTPYQFAGNTPIQAKDLDGLEPSYVYQNSKGQWVEAPAGDNLSRPSIPQGHEQFKHNSFSWASRQELDEKYTQMLNFIPWLGEFKGAWESVTGEEWVTGRKLSSEERMMALLPVRAKGATGAVVRNDIKQVAKAEAATTKVEKQVQAAHSGNTNAATTNTTNNSINSSAVHAGTQSLGKEASSVVLGNSLEAIGVQRPPNTAAHHIVAGGDSRADFARQILKREGIDINEATNGVFLPKNSKYANPPASTHSQLHTDKYYLEITEGCQVHNQVK